MKFSSFPAARDTKLCQTRSSDSTLLPTSPALAVPGALGPLPAAALSPVPEVTDPPLPARPHPDIKVTLQTVTLFLIFTQSASDKPGLDQAPSSLRSNHVAILWIRVLFLFV